MTYSEILARLETATGPDREIDAMIAYAVNLMLTDKVSFRTTFDAYAGDVVLRSFGIAGAPPYTASLDAVTALIDSELPGWGKAVSDTPALGKCGGLFPPDNSKDYRSVGCASLPLALLKAAISALADKEAAE